MSYKLKEVITVQEALDNLAVIGEIDLERPPLLGVVQEIRLVTDRSELSAGAVRWLSEEGEEPILEILDRTYRTIHRHLRSLYENPQTDWGSQKLESGIAAMMALVGESAVKMDRYLAFREGIPEGKRERRISDRSEFRQLQQFYVEELIHKFSDRVEGDEAWKEEWGRQEESSLGTMSALKDFESVRRDEEYELFYIRNEEGTPYFSSELLRNIKLTADMEGTGEGFEEDPLLRIRSITDRDLQFSAGQILGECLELLQEFYRHFEQWRELPQARLVSMAVLALFLTANPRNLLQTTNGKSCQQYFQDFLEFLRQVFASDEYQRDLAYPPPKEERMKHLVFRLAHQLSFALFTHPGGVRQEVIGLIHRAVRKGQEKIRAVRGKDEKGDCVWNQMLLEDERLRTYLSKFPSGPLFKILDLIREEEGEEWVGFDPIHQGNFPSRLYQMKRGKKKRIDVLRIPSPIVQQEIRTCDIAKEFHGYLRHLSGESKKHLLINLNDRTSWREYGRAKVLEDLQKKAEHSKHLIVLTLPKATDFYHQNNEYLNLSRAEDFLAALQTQLNTPEECGFRFPLAWKGDELNQFIEQLLPLIHRQFFQSRLTLSRQAREDFIEIAYQFLILKVIDRIDPDSISFTCKDAIDVGAASGATFYGFLKLLHADFSKQEDVDFLRWLYYMPALLVRERAIAPGPLNRSLAVLERLDATLAISEDQILKDFGKLYSPQFLESLSECSQPSIPKH